MDASCQHCRVLLPFSRGDALPQTIERKIAYIRSKELIENRSREPGRVEETVEKAEQERWMAHYMYRVPAYIKNLNASAYKPQVVSLGPSHHGDPELLPMKEHKFRALWHVAFRAGLTANEFVAAVAFDDVMEQLKHAYMNLGHRGRIFGSPDYLQEQPKRPDGDVGVNFMKVMVTDGCFLLEVMGTAAGEHVEEYDSDDPIFSRHGVLYTVPYIRRDMLMIENQFPLLLLQRIVAVATGISPSNDFINRMVLKFLSPSRLELPIGDSLGLHPLDVLRRSMLFGTYHFARGSVDSPESDTIRSAVELHEAGISFKQSRTSSLRDIYFRQGVLSMPQVPIDDSAEYVFLNMMAFERLHAAAGNDVTAYVFFMHNLINSAADVALLRSKGVIQNACGSDNAVAKMFDSISRDVVLQPNSALDAVQRELYGYCRNNCRNMLYSWGMYLVDKYQNPWTVISLLAAIVLLTLTVVQTVYTVLSFYDHKDG